MLKHLKMFQLRRQRLTAGLFLCPRFPWPVLAEVVTTENRGLGLAARRVTCLKSFKVIINSTYKKQQFFCCSHSSCIFAYFRKVFFSFIFLEFLKQIILQRAPVRELFLTRILKHSLTLFDNSLSWNTARAISFPDYWNCRNNSQVQQTSHAYSVTASFAMCEWFSPFYHSHLFFCDF